MKKTKKAQASMEFLMTYGWAILVIVLLVGALAYFGILTPPKPPITYNCGDYLIKGIRASGEFIEYDIQATMYELFFTENEYGYTPMQWREISASAVSFDKRYCQKISETESQLIEQIYKEIYNKETFDYCIEWDGWINRENLIYDCYSFEDQEQKCIYNIMDNVLWVYDLNYTFIDSYMNCTRAIRSLEINK